MSKYSNLQIEVTDQIQTININRPEKLNALNIKTIEELKDCIQTAYDDGEVKGIIITGTGEKSFVAGADIKEIADLNEVNARKFSENGQEVFELIEKCPKPVIAVINGYALGGGMELALACHLRVASENAIMGLPEVTLGIIPGYGGTQRLSQLVGKGKAFELIMTGEKIDATEAFRLGLVNYVCKSIDLAKTKSTDILNKIFENAPLAISMTIDCINAAFLPDEDGYLIEANSFANCCTSEDFHEGTKAFLEKRKPNFKGK